LGHVGSGFEGQGLQDFTSFSWGKGVVRCEFHGVNRVRLPRELIYINLLSIETTSGQNQRDGMRPRCSQFPDFGHFRKAFIWPMRLLALVAWAVASLRDRRITPLLFDIAAKRLAMGNVPQDVEEMGNGRTLFCDFVQFTTFPILC